MSECMNCCQKPCECPVTGGIPWSEEVRRRRIAMSKTKFVSCEGCERLTSERDALKAEIAERSDDLTRALAEVARLTSSIAHMAESAGDDSCADYELRATRAESALSEALAALQLARESLVEQNYRLYMNRKTCRCWGKMTGSCPNCAKSTKIENQGSDAITIADTAHDKLRQEVERLRANREHDAACHEVKVATLEAALREAERAMTVASGTTTILGRSQLDRAIETARTVLGEQQGKGEP